MEFSFDIGILGALVLAFGALALGVALQLLGSYEQGYEWLVTGVAAFIGGFVASEFIVGWQAWEPVFDGLALIPALIGAIVVGVPVAVVTRLSTGGSYRSTASV